MTPIENGANDYLQCQVVHNYSTATTDNRRCYLGYVVDLAAAPGAISACEVDLALVKAYQFDLLHVGSATVECSRLAPRCGASSPSVTSSPGS